MNATLYHATDAVPTLAGLTIQAVAARHHRQPDQRATVCLVLPSEPAQPQHVAYLDVATARQFARHVLECAEVAERSDHPQTEREALDEAISMEALDRAVSDMVGLRP